MSSPTKTTETERGANLFLAIAQITRLLHASHVSDQKWSYEIIRHQAPDGSYLGKCFDDGCIINIRIEPPAPPEKTPDAAPATH
jgi:hypothetical protein